MSQHKREKIKGTLTHKNEFVAVSKEMTQSADLIGGGRLFHSLAPTTSKAQSSLVLKSERETVRRPRLEDWRGQLQ